MSKKLNHEVFSEINENATMSLRKCPKCNALLPGDSAFCPYCGVSILAYIQETTSSVEEINELKCCKCNQIIPEDSEFCPYCGSKVNCQNLSKSKFAPKEKLSEPIEPQRLQKNTNENDLKKNKKRKKWIRTISLCLVVVIAFCALGYHGYIEFYKDLDEIETAFESSNYEYASQLYNESFWLQIGEPKIQKYVTAWNLFYEEKYEEAKSMFLKLDEYRDSVYIAANVKRYQDALSQSNALSQLKSFKDLWGFADSEQRVKSLQHEVYTKGVQYYNQEKFELAKGFFESLPSYKDSYYYLQACSGFLKIKSETESIKVKGFSELRKASLKVDVSQGCMSNEYIDYFLDGEWRSNKGNRTFTYNHDDLTFGFYNCFYIPDGSYQFTEFGLKNSNSQYIVSWELEDVDTIAMWAGNGQRYLVSSGPVYTFNRVG